MEAGSVLNKRKAWSVKEWELCLLLSHGVEVRQVEHPACHVHKSSTHRNPYNMTNVDHSSTLVGEVNHIKAHFRNRTKSNVTVEWVHSRFNHRHTPSALEKSGPVHWVVSCKLTKKTKALFFPPLSVAAREQTVRVSPHLSEWTSDAASAPVRRNTTYYRRLKWVSALFFSFFFLNSTLLAWKSAHPKLRTSAGRETEPSVDCRHLSFLFFFFFSTQCPRKPVKKTKACTICALGSKC